MSKLLSSRTAQFCLILFTFGLLFGLYGGWIKFDTPIGTFEGGLKVEERINEVAY
jgi:hypothetical protein